MSFKNKDLINRVIKANDLNYAELLADIEIEKLYLMRLYQQGKNENTKLSLNDLEFNDEIELTNQIIRHKEILLKYVRLIKLNVSYDLEFKFRKCVFCNRPYKLGSYCKNCIEDTK